MGTKSDSKEIYVVKSEPDEERTYHCEALASRFPTATEIDYPAGERVPVDSAAAVVLTGSTAAVYEPEQYPWVDDQQALIRRLVDRSVPTLGVCFGHQIANAALGGTVEHVGMTAGLVEADLGHQPLFEGVAPVVPALHGDAVTALGDGMESIASAPHADIFASRHQSAPLWTVQFHPEITAALEPRLTEDFEWESGQWSFGDVTAEMVFENFKSMAESAPAAADSP